MHSSASFDCAVHPEVLARRCWRLGLDPVFLTDHNTIDGALLLQRRYPSRVVVGEEVETREGEIIGLFLRRLVQPGLSALDTVHEIKAQGGLVYIEHPYDSARRRLNERALERIGDHVDIVEVFNGRSSGEANMRAEELRDILDAAPGAGSDAHELSSLGSVYMEIEDFQGPPDFLLKLRRARIVRDRPPWLLTAEARLGRLFGR